MTEQIDKAIQKAANHWAGQSNFDTGDTLIAWLKRRKGPISIHPERGWSKSKLSDWGQAQKLTRGLRALKRAVEGNPSHQWLAVWMKSNER